MEQAFAQQHVMPGQRLALFGRQDIDPLAPGLRGLQLAARVDAHHLVPGQPLVHQKNRTTCGDTPVSSQTTSIFGYRVGSMAAKSASSLRSFCRPARNITRWPSLKDRIAVDVALGLELQRQRADLLAPVEYQRFHQSRSHGRLQVEVGDDVREVQLLPVPAVAHVVVRRGREVHLREAPPLALGDQHQAFSATPPR
ncbi:hypothetical protein ACFS3C_12290 [Azotobacter vinelandii]